MNLLKYISLGFLGYRVYSLYAKKAAEAMDWEYTINWNWINQVQHKAD
jgi:hypothetical protein